MIYVLSLNSFSSVDCSPLLVVLISFEDITNSIRRLTGLNIRVAVFGSLDRAVAQGGLGEHWVLSVENVAVGDSNIEGPKS